MGLAAERARRDEEALAAYERFIAEAPEHPQRAVAETRIGALRAEIDRARAAAVSVAPEPEPEPAPSAPSPEIERHGGSEAEMIAGVALAIGGAIALGTGWGLWAELDATYGRFDALQHSDRLSPVFTELQDRMLAYRVGTLVSGVASGVLLTSALVLLLPEEPGVPWWSFVGAGVGAVVAGLGIWQLAEPGQPIGPADEVSTEPAWLGGHLLAHALPLLSMPVVYGVRELSRGSISTAAVTFDSGGFLLRVGGSF